MSGFHATHYDIAIIHINILADIHMNGGENSYLQVFRPFLANKCHQDQVLTITRLYFYVCEVLLNLLDISNIHILLK